MNKITKVTDIDKYKLTIDGCTVTYSGFVLDLMDPDPDLIRLEDIAHCLAFNSRWNGATRRFYSIAEHSIRVANRCMPDKKRALAGLFHDAEEAYFGDIISPLKAIIRTQAPGLLVKMSELRQMIFDKFNIEYFDVSKEDWDEAIDDFEGLVLDGRRKTLSPEQAEIAWFNKYLMLK